ncbi:hypothetical protein BGX24_010174 [Mortierella sp. AD032]|nr:hypothetical protein BGX24_010174 [Mortierella sp. AD032]
MTHDEAGFLDIPSTIRSQWTWDWGLPKLTTFALTGEFAYLFEFRMLDGCPCLETMDLRISTDNEQITRIISDTGDNTNSDDDSNNGPSGPSLPPQLRRIIAPVVKHLLMEGHWIFDRILLSAFLNGLFLNLQVLNVEEWGGIQLQDFVEVIATGSTKLKNLFLFFERLSVEVMRAYRTFIEDEVGGEDVFPGKIRFLGEGHTGDEFVVLK